MPTLWPLLLPRSRSLLFFIFLVFSFFLAFDGDGGGGESRGHGHGRRGRGGGGVYAQSFAIPANWRKPTSSVSRHDRASLVDAVLDTLLPTFDASSGLLDGLTFTQTASLLVALSNSDAIAGATKNKDAVLTSLDTAFALNPNISTLWGLAAVSAYRAYKDTSALQHAQAMWDLLEGYLVTPDDAAQGTHPLKEVQFQGDCNGASTAGGVFYLASSPQNTDVNGETVGAFMALSAHLHAETANTTYLTAANLTASFILNHLFNGVVVLDTITLANCFTTQDVVTYNSGFVLEGLSLLASVKGIGDISPGVSYEQFLESLISTAVTTPRWTNATDGIIVEGPSNATLAETNDFGQALKGIFVRGLYEAYNRTSPGSVVADFISSFITVQFNALQDRACIPGGHSYSSRWEGPPPTQMLPWGQLAALDVLNSAVGIAPPDSSTSSEASTTSSSALSTSVHSALATSPSSTWTTQADSDTPHHSTSPTKTAIIAGSLAGAFVFLVLSILMALYMIRRKRKRLDHIRNVLEETAVPYGPYPVASSSGSSSGEGDSSRGGMVQVGYPSAAESESTERLVPGGSTPDVLTDAPPLRVNTSRRQISVAGKMGARRSGLIVPVGRYAVQEPERRAGGVDVSPTERRDVSSRSRISPVAVSPPAGDSEKEAGGSSGASAGSPSGNETVPRIPDRQLSLSLPLPPSLEEADEGAPSSLSPAPPAPPAPQAARLPPSTADLPELLNRLNQIMSHLPPGGVEEEEPPEYEG